MFCVARELRTSAGRGEVDRVGTPPASGIAPQFSSLPTSVCWNLFIHSSLRKNTGLCRDLMFRSVRTVLKMTGTNTKPESFPSSSSELAATLRPGGTQPAGEISSQSYGRASAKLRGRLDASQRLATQVYCNFGVQGELAYTSASEIQAIRNANMHDIHTSQEELAWANRNLAR